MSARHLAGCDTRGGNWICAAGCPVAAQRTEKETAMPELMTEKDPTQPKENGAMFVPKPNLEHRPEDVVRVVDHYATQQGVKPTNADYARAGYWAAVGRTNDALVMAGSCPIGMEASAAFGQAEAAGVEVRNHLYPGPLREVISEVLSLVRIETTSDDVEVLADSIEKSEWLRDKVEKAFLAGCEDAFAFDRNLFRQMRQDQR